MPTADNLPLVAPNDGAPPARPSAHDRRRHKVLRFAVRGLVLVALSALVVLAVIAVAVPRLLGAVPLTVVSGSMEPVLSPGDLVVVLPADANTLAVGDVVTFQPESDNPALVTHRIVGLTVSGDGTTGFITQGDANSVADEPIVADQVMGRVLYSLPLVGHITATSWGQPLLAAIAVGLAGYGIATFIASRRSPEGDHDA